MHANWSLILNVLLLVGVVVAIGRLMKARRKSANFERYQPNLGTEDKERSTYNDDIIAVRKVTNEPMLYTENPSFKKDSINTNQPRLLPDDNEEVVLKAKPQPQPAQSRMAVDIDNMPSGSTIMMFLLAKENRQFAGYELLQTVLAAGLRFGEGNLFHRHQFSNGDGVVLCSLAAATATGIFDLQNIGAFSARGLCLYMHSTNDPSTNAERFSVMLDTARQLSDGLDAYLLDDQRRPLTEERIERYQQLLQIEPEFA